MKLLLLHAVVNLAYGTSYVGRLGSRRVVVHPCIDVTNFAVENFSRVLFFRTLRNFFPPLLLPFPSTLSYVFDDFSFGVDALGREGKVRSGWRGQMGFRLILADLLFVKGPCCLAYPRPQYLSPGKARHWRG